MKSKVFLVSFIALLAMAFALNTVIASECNSYVCIDEIEVDGIDAGDFGEAIGLTVSDTVPVVVRFTAVDNGDDVRDQVTDVRIKTYIEGYRNEISDETSRFHILEGNTYVKRFSLRVPSTLDIDDLSESLELLVRVSARGEDSLEVELPLEIQRESYSLNLLSIDASDVVVVGNTVSMDIVVENNGNERLDNVYVRASIPDLQTSRQVYVGDLAPDTDRFDDDINDAVVRRVYLTIPKNAAPGNYEMEIEAYNYETSVLANSRIVIDDLDTTVVSASTSKTISPGADTSFDLVLVNPNNRMVVYTITPKDVTGLIVEVSEPVVAVSADSSRTVQVNVRATDSVEEGTYVVTVNANSESGLSRQVSFSVTVEKDSDGSSSTTSRITSSAIGNADTTVVLTVILVIVFVVLLIILIVLLTKRPAESEEFGETNYY